MNKRSVRRIHQANDAVIDVAGQIGHKVSGMKALSELRNLGNRREIRKAAGTPFQPFCWVRSGGNSSSPTLWDIDPNMSVALFARIGGRKDAAGIERIALG